MCVIVHKQPDTILSNNTIRQMFTTNRNGAGFLYINRETTPASVHVLKGLMTVKELIKAYKLHELDKHEAVIHFRLATHGKISPDNCHPFKIDSRSYLFHNGIMSAFGTAEINDSRAFAECLGRLSINNRHSIIETAAAGWNKFALYDRGAIYTFGHFHKFIDGIEVSNLNWQPLPARAPMGYQTIPATTGQTQINWKSGTYGDKVDWRPTYENKIAKEAARILGATSSDIMTKEEEDEALAAIDKDPFYYKNIDEIYEDECGELVVIDKKHYPLT